MTTTTTRTINDWTVIVVGPTDPIITGGQARDLTTITIREAGVEIAAVAIQAETFDIRTAGARVRIDHARREVQVRA